MLLATGCHTHAKRLPQLQMAPDSFRTAVRGICVGEVATSIGPDDEQEERLVALEVAATEVLEGAGYRVVASPAATELWQRLVRAGGGLYDPHFGSFLPDRHEEIRRAYFTALSAELGCQALLELRLVAVSAYWQETFANWDGVQDRMGDYLGTAGLVGRVPALSVWVYLRSLEHDDLYFGSGGIQLLERRETELLASRFQPVEQGQLPDAGLLRVALRIALDELPGVEPYRVRWLRR